MVGAIGLAWYFTAGASCSNLPWTLPARWAWLVLKCGQVVTAVLGVWSLMMFMKYQDAEVVVKQMRNYKSVCTEFNTIAFAGLTGVCGFGSAMFAPGWPSCSWFHSVFLGMMFVWIMYSLIFRVFLSGSGSSNIATGSFPSFMITAIWENMDLDAWMKKEMENHYMGTLTHGLSRLSETSLWFLRVVQAGQPDAGDDEYAGHSNSFVKLNKALGGMHPKYCMLLIRPTFYMEVSAIDFHEIDDASLLHFNQNLCMVLRKLTTADTIYFPYGTKLKMGRFMPFARLSMSDYAGEIRKIDPNVMPNEELPEAREDEG